jgi:valyl-tRNA synthetase
VPFKNVYLTGIVRDKQGRKMSKSAGQQPDPLELIEKYGADGVRVGMLLTSPAGNDLLFDDSLCEQGRNFSNKIWNAFRLVKSWEGKVDPAQQQSESSRVAVEWMNSRFSQVLAELNDDYDKFRISEALMETYKLVWDDFCAWYLEMVKPPYGQAIDPATYEATLNILENVLKVLHPFMPFLTEEIWHYLREREPGRGSVCVASWPEAGPVSESLLGSFTRFAEVVAGIRTIRKDNNIAGKEPIRLLIRGNDNRPAAFDAALIHLCNIISVEIVAEKPANSFSFIESGTEYFIPFTGNVDVEAEKKKINQELDYARGFLKSVEAKLTNERFVNNAPAQVLDAERKKQADARSKISLLEEKLAGLQ